MGFWAGFASLLPKDGSEIPTPRPPAGGSFLSLGKTLFFEMPLSSRSSMNSSATHMIVCHSCPSAQLV